MNRVGAHGQGVEIDIRRAVLHYATVHKLSALYAQWGYRPYLLPLIDSYSIYSTTLDAHDTPQSFRFVNNNGELVLLRPDLTLFLARHVAHTLQREHLPLRVWYSDSVLHNVIRNEGETTERYQSGVELIGKAGVEAEIELLLLAQETVATLPLANSVMHIGSRRLLRSMFPNCSTEHYITILSALSVRHDAALRTHLMKEGYSTHEAIALAALLMYIGSDDTIPIPTLKNTKVAAAIEMEINTLHHIVKTMRKIGVDNVRIDLSEVGERNYYTGVVFAIYHPDVAEKIAGGGRYDSLFGIYGFETTSIGFTVFLHRCEEHMAMPSSDMSVSDRAKGATFLERYSNACAQRAEGKSVSL